MALGLSTLSFAAGVAGDLSIIDPPRSGQRVVLRIPPEIPADAPRAGPLLSTAMAQAAPVRLVPQPRREEVLSLVAAMQAAHEAEFEAAPVAFEIAELPPQKPRRDIGVKPTPDVPPAAHETKAA